MELYDLSVVYNAAKVMSALRSGQDNAEMEVVATVAAGLYGKGVVPFVFSENFGLPLHLFSSRLRNLLETDTLSARRLWGFITARENIIRMITATEMDRPAAEGLSFRFRYHYENKPADRDEVVKFKQIIGYMVKIVMELSGYTVERKRVLISTKSAGNPEGKVRYFSTASRYRKIKAADVEEVCGKIEDESIREVFSEMMMSVLEARTSYQQILGIDELRG